MELLSGNSEIVPGIELEVVPGHNRDMMIVRARSSDETFCFLSDLVPSTHHVKPTWIGAVDLFPLTSIDNKTRILTQAAAENWWCAYAHDADASFSRIGNTEVNWKLSGVSCETAGIQERTLHRFSFAGAIAGRWSRRRPKCAVNWGGSTSYHRGRARQAPSTFNSTNPARPSEIVGVHQKATAEQAKQAIEAACAIFPRVVPHPGGVSRRKFGEGRRDPSRTQAGIRRLAGLRSRQDVAGGRSRSLPKPSISANTMRAKWRAWPVRSRWCNCPASATRCVYIPLGVGIVIPPWNFPLAILAGMTVAALVTGNVVVIKPSSETPTIAAKFAEVLIEAGFPARSFSLLTGSGAAIGDVLVNIPRRDSSPSPARAMSVCGSTNWPPSLSRARSGSSAWSPKWAAKTPSSSMAIAISIRPPTAW